MSEIAAQPGDVIDFSQAEMPVKIEDRSFDARMVPELLTYLKDIRDHSLDYVVPGSKMEVKPVGGSAIMTDRTIFPEDRGTGYALINAMTLASKDMGLDRMHDMAKIAGNVKNVMKVVC